MLTVRWIALASAAGFLTLALGIRTLAGQDVLDSSGTLAQRSGTILYASMIYAGVVLLWPRVRPVLAGAAAIGFCWTVELLQLTGVPAELSARSVVARLALGVQFDAADLAWYPIGVLPVGALHLWYVRSAQARGAG